VSAPWQINLKPRANVLVMNGTDGYLIRHRCSPVDRVAEQQTRHITDKKKAGLFNLLEQYIEYLIDFKT
jgi:hypothetical protein